MNNQLDAFDAVPPVFARAHSNDPRSSHEAAAEGERTGRFKRQAAQVLEWLKRYPGTTSAELSKVSGMDLYAVRRRLTDLYQVNVVRRIDGDSVPCSVSGKRVCRWDLVN